MKRSQVIVTDDFSLARQYLQQPRMMHEKYEAIKREIERLRTFAEKTVPTLSADRIQVSKSGKENEDLIIRIVQRWDEYRAKMLVYEEVRHEVCENIYNYANKYGEVLEQIYLENMTLAKVAEFHDHTTEWAVYTRKKGERMLQKKIVEHPEKFTLVTDF